MSRTRLDTSALEPQVTHRFEEAVRKAVEAGVSAGFETLQRDLESSNLGEYDMKTLVARMDDRIGRMERKMSLVLLKLQSVGEIDSADWWKLGSDDCEGEEEEPGEGG